ncbi:protein ABSCISIC ACID-INSENSITIVE 5 isoform X2 [Mercurialis annua]|nr:protein ABSCISIC ACID-INSENSITIVE 5 isoform X2 [Mercurialis annua]
MAVTDSEVTSQGEVDSPLQSDQPSKNHPFSSLGRQSSIYSLTLDEFQHALFESGKNFGSMNMDEFLTSIWNAEENNQAAAVTSNNNDHLSYMNNGKGNKGNHQGGYNDVITGNDHRTISKQPSLARQGSLTLPAPLCRKTVDEVWSDIHREHQQRGQHSSSTNNLQNPESASRQPTYGEMTLEDFLVKAGVVREHGTTNPSPPLFPPQQPQYGLYQNTNSNNPATGTGFVSRPVLGACGVGGARGGGLPGNAGTTLETSERNGGFVPLTVVPPSGSVYGGRIGNGGGYAPIQGTGVVGQVSPVSSDAMVDNVPNQFGIDGGGLRGRKRTHDGPVEKVVERRQRRMIKNRESAARSRARKQAYTVELEAELNQLKEENKQLRHALAELERKRRQQHLEEVRMKAQSKAQKAKEKLRIMRRNFSCPL